MIACPLCPATHPDPGNICPGRCNDAWIKAERHQDTTGQPHDLQPTPGQPIWCPDCRDNITADLQDLPRLVAGLGSGPLAQADPNTSHLHLVDVHASPSPAFDLADEVERWAAAWANNTRDWLGHPPDASTWGYLAGHLSPLLCRDPDGIAFGMETQRYRRRLAGLTGRIRATIRVAGQCPNTKCARRGTMTRKDGTELVRCSACHGVWDYEQPALLERAS